VRLGQGRGRGCSICSSQNPPLTVSSVCGASSYFEDDERIAKQVALIHEDTAGSATFRPGVFVNIAASGRTYRPIVLKWQSPR
jgi:hypothetical protein